MSDPWRVVFAAGAVRELDRLPAAERVRAAQLIAELALDPAPRTRRRVVGTAYWRMRVGDLRVMYELLPEVREVVIVRVARRSESTYGRLKA